MRSPTLATLLVTLAIAVVPPTGAAKPIQFRHVASGGTGAGRWTVYRGGRIRSSHDLRWLKRRGVTRIMSLDRYRHRRLRRVARRLGMSYLPYFMGHGRRRDPGRRALGVQVTDDLAIPGQTTYVHCAHGTHRTGGVIGRFRAEQGWDCRRIFRELRSFGFKRWQYKLYRELIAWVRQRCRHNGAPKRGAVKANGSRTASNAPARR